LQLGQIQSTNNAKSYQFWETHVFRLSKGAQRIKLHRAVRQKGAISKSAERQKCVQLQNGLQYVEPGGAPSDDHPRHCQGPSNAMERSVDCVFNSKVLATWDVENPSSKHGRKADDCSD
jgi:hypothetical protein